jgi:uroporphyrinogen decarboxylase
MTSFHLGWFFERYGGELRIMGGVDKTRLSVVPDETRRYLESLLRHIERGGCIPFCDHRCSPDATQQHYLHYLDPKEQLFGS